MFILSSIAIVKKCLQCIQLHSDANINASCCSKQCKSRASYAVNQNELVSGHNVHNSYRGSLFNEISETDQNKLIGESQIERNGAPVHDKIDKNISGGTYMYSFALSPEQYQPSTITFHLPYRGPDTLHINIDTPDLPTK